MRLLENSNFHFRNFLENKKKLRTVREKRGRRGGKREREHKFVRILYANEVSAVSLSHYLLLNFVIQG